MNLNELHTNLEQNLTNGRLLLAESTTGSAAITEFLETTVNLESLQLENAQIDPFDPADSQLTVRGTSSQLFDLLEVSVETKFETLGDDVAISLAAALPEAVGLDIPGFSIGSLGLSFQQNERDDDAEGPLPVTGAIQGYIRFNGVDIPLQLALPVSSTSWYISGSFEEVPIPSLTDLTQLIGNDDLLSFLPMDFIEIDRLALAHLGILFNPSERSVPFIDLNIVAPQWEVVSGAFSIHDVDFALQLDRPLEATGRAVSGEITSVVRVGQGSDEVDIPLAFQYDNNTGDCHARTSTSNIALSNFPDLMQALGGNQLGSSAPAVFSDLGSLSLNRLEASLNLNDKAISRLAVALGYEWDIVPNSLSLEEGSLWLEVDNPQNNQTRQLHGGVTGTFDLAGIEVTLSAEVADELVFTGTVPELKLYEILEDPSVGLSLPEGLPAEEVTFSDLTVSVSSAGSFALAGTTSLDWDFGTRGPTFNTALGFSFSYTVPDDTGTAESTSTCSIAVSGDGPLALVDELRLKEVEVTFEINSDKEWGVTGTLAADLLGLSTQLGVRYNKAAGSQSLELFSTLGGELVFIEEIDAAFSLSSLRINIFKEPPVRQPPATTGWLLTAEGDLHVGDTIQLTGGQLELYDQGDGQAGLRFLPDEASLDIPLLPESEAALWLNFNYIEIKKADADWSFAAAVRYGLRNCHEQIHKMLPSKTPEPATGPETEPIEATFTADKNGFALTNTALIDFDIPDININAETISLGSAAIGVTRLAFEEIDGQIDVSADLTIELPSKLNNLFGVKRNDNNSIILNEEGEPIPAMELFSESVALRLGIRDGEVYLMFVTSPIKAITLTVEDGVSLVACDFGDYGAAKFTIPSFAYDGYSFAVTNVSFELERPLVIPLAPLKSLLRACDMADAAVAFPHTLPVNDIRILDADDNFQDEEMFALLEKTGLVLPDELKETVRFIGTRFDKLPDNFRKYLNVTTPDSFALDIAITADGGAKVDIKGKPGPDGERGEPIRILYPDMSGGIPTRIYGFEIYSLSFGEILGGSLFLLQADLNIDRFDLLTLAAALALPNDEKLPLPASQELQKRLVIEKLFMLIVYQTVIPIPVPIFYTELGVQYLDLEGVKLYSHVSFPMPEMNLSEAAATVSNFKEFFTDRDATMPTEPLNKMDITFSLPKTFVELPKYLGGQKLSLEVDGKPIEISASSSIAHMMNGIKTLELNKLIQGVPLQYRTGSSSVSFGPLTAEADWLLSTPDEFRSDAQEALTAAAAEDFASILPAVSTDSNGAGNGEQGLVTLLSGRWDVPNVTSFDAAFGLAASGSVGFNTGFKIAGNIDNLIDAELAGQVAINTAGQQAPAQIESGGSQNSTSGSLPRVLSFDGQGGHLNLGNSAELQITGNQTIEMWIKPANFSRRQNPYAKAYGGEGTITVEKSGQVTYYHGTAGDNKKEYDGFRTTNSLPAGEWSHIAVVRDLDQMKLTWYVNGEQVDQKVAPYNAAKASNRNAKIGAGYAGRFRGEISDVRIWNVARSQTAIQTKMQQRLSGYEPGLAGYWPLNGETRNIAFKVSSDNDGALKGGASWHQDEPFKGLLFDGQDDAVIINPVKGFPTTEFTVECWIKSSSTNRDGTLISYATVQNDNTLILYNHRNLDVYLLGSNTGSTGISFTDGQWHHLAVTWQSKTGALKIYKDGRLEKSFTQAKELNITDGGALVFGQEQDSVGGGFQTTQAFDGSLSNVRIWNKVRSTAAIQADMHRPLSGHEQGLVGYWPLNEGGGNTAFNQAKPNNETLKNASWLPDTPFQTTGLTFDGQHDKVIIHPMSGFPATELTLECWIKSSNTSKNGTPISYANAQSDNAFLLFNHRNLNVHFGGISTGGTGVGFTDGLWHHLAVTWQSKTGALKIYKDGRLEKTYTKAKNHSIKDGGALVFGQEQDSVAGRFSVSQAFEGSLSDVRLWNKLRSKDEIQATMHRPLSGLERGLVGYWPLHERSGQKAYDLAGGKHGDVTDGTWLEHKLVQLDGLRFDGQNDHVSFGDLEPGNNSWTVEMWFNCTQTDGLRALYSKVSQFQARVFDGQFQFYSKTGNRWNSANFPVEAGRWYHVAVVYDLENDAIDIYGNGEHVFTRAESRSIGWGGYSLRIGNKSNQNWPFAGQIAEVRMWRTARKAAAIKRDMYRQLAGKEANLAGYWPFNDGWGQNASDLANDRTGNVNGAQWVKPSPMVLEGMAFNGQDSVAMAKPVSGFPARALTLECWIKSSDSSKNGTPISYANSQGDNTLILYNHRNLDVYLFGGRTGSTGISFTDGQWHHLAVTWQSDTGDLKIYKDGRLEKSYTKAKNRSIADGGAFVFGQEQDSVGGRFSNSQAFDGSLDEVHLWNKVRSQEEIQAGMFTRLSGKEQNLAGYWPLTAQQGNTAVDLAGNNDMVLQAVQWQRPQAPATSAASAAVQLTGHSHLTILEDRIFQGNVQLIDDRFWLKGNFDLFPNSLDALIAVKGMLDGRLSSNQLKLDGAVDAVLGGLVLSQATVAIDNKRVQLRGRWLDFVASLDVDTIDEKLRLEGAVAVNYDVGVEIDADHFIATLKAKIPFLNQVEIGSFPAISLEAGFSGDLKVSVVNNVPAFSLDGALYWDDEELDLPLITLSAAPTDVQGLIDETVDYLMNDGLSSLLALVDSSYLQGTGSAEVDFSLDFELDVNAYLPSLASPFSIPRLPIVKADLRFDGELGFTITGNTATFRLTGSVTGEGQPININIAFDSADAPRNVDDLITAVRNHIRNTVLDRLRSLVDLALKLGSNVLFKGKKVPVGLNKTAIIDSSQVTFGGLTLKSGRYRYISRANSLSLELQDTIELGVIGTAAPLKLKTFKIDTDTNTVSGEIEGKLKVGGHEISNTTYTLNREGNLLKLTGGTSTNLGFKKSISMTGWIKSNGHYSFSGSTSLNQTIDVAGTKFRFNGTVNATLRHNGGLSATASGRVDVRYWHQPLPTLSNPLPSGEWRWRKIWGDTVGVNSSGYFTVKGKTFRI